MRHPKIYILGVSILFLGGFLYIFFPKADAQSNGSSGADVTVLELNELIKDKQNSINDLKRRISTYESNIDAKRDEAVSLENELLIIEDEVAKTALDIQAKEQEIDQLDLEIKQANLQIEAEEVELGERRGQLGEFVRQVHDNDQKSMVEVILMNDSLSDFFDQIRYLEEAQTELVRAISRIKVLREQLETQKQSLEYNKKRQEELRDGLLESQAALDEKRTARQKLVVQSILSAERFEALLEDARREQSSVDAEIQDLEKTKRNTLNTLGSNGEISMVWPVDPSRGITTYFKDPGYPFRHIFEHAAIDIRAYQGTPLRAVEDGYVARTKFSGKSYAYIMLLHDDGLSSVYGHVSRVAVSQDTYVKKGDIIGYSGGMPGTNGAGSYTTGPHLHFEIRKNGIPVDPLKYLP